MSEAQWTLEPPTESGWYPIREGKKKMLVEVRVTPLGGGETYWSCLRFGIEDVLCKDDIPSMWEWWPIPLTAPED